MIEMLEVGGGRLGVVDPTPERMDRARTIAARGKPWRGRDDIWFSPVPLLPKGGIAFVFPGLEADFAPRVDDVAALLDSRVPDLSTRTVGRHAAAVLGIGRLLDNALRLLNIRPDAVAGHSVGEWVAMVAGGILAGSDLDDLLARADLDSLRVPGVEFAVLGCGAERAAAEIGPELVISHENSTNQTVVCGPAAEIGALVDRLRRKAVICQVLPFRSGFHTPMLAPYLDTFEAGVPSLPMRPATVPVWSATTASTFPADPVAARELCMRHLLEPVRFRALITNLYESGVRVFVQAGPGQLGSLIDDTLRDAEHLTIVANSAQRPGIEQLRRVAAAIWAEGGQPDFTALARGRTETPLHSTRFPAVAELSALLEETAASVALVLAAVEAPTLEVTTAAMPYLLDHCLVEQRDGWPDESDRWPVVPATTMVEHMCDAARRAVPGRIVTEVLDARFHKWLEAEPGKRIAVEVDLLGPERVSVRLGDYAQAVVVLGREYPPGPAPWPADPDERLPALSARQIYDERWLFHGKRFQGISRPVAISEHTMRGEITIPDAPGALLDNVGHYIGQWLVEHNGDRYIAFPVRIERIAFHAPQPPVGSTVDCRLRLGVEGEALRAEAQLYHRGRPLVTITGWRDTLFDGGEAVTRVHRWAARNTLAERHGDGWRLAADALGSLAVREFCMRKYLNSAERREYAARPPTERRRWLLERILVKDAVRGLRWDRGAGPIFPAEVTELTTLDIHMWMEGSWIVCTARETAQ
jgi:malonyl CoA-acyl carrier protein transacylase